MRGGMQDWHTYSYVKITVGACKRGLHLGVREVC